MSRSSDRFIPNKCASRRSNNNSVYAPRRSIFRMIISSHFARGSFPHSPLQNDIILWKMDRRGPFTLLSFDPRDAYFFGMELLDDLLIFFVYGCFDFLPTYPSDDRCIPVISHIRFFLIRISDFFLRSRGYQAPTNE